ncbi:hypothetical protein T484DRAFT_1963913 [Baffinella frigidus]|nr:hypothetical protein T484DRAFT_1963913 [Cryptophyta sp. CCMP2293]
MIMHTCKPTQRVKHVPRASSTRGTCIARQAPEASHVSGGRTPCQSQESVIHPHPSTHNGSFPSENRGRAKRPAMPPPNYFIRGWKW